MKQPVVGSSTSQEPGLFNFTSRLEFEASSNLLRSRSDTCLRKHRNQSDIPPRRPTIINPWTIPTIDFTLHCYKPKYSRFEAKKNQNKRRRNKDFVKIPLPKVLETPVSKETPFVTTFRSPSARTSRIMGAREAMHPAGPYKPWGPHAFRGDDFRPDSGIRNEGKSSFVTTYSRDPGNLELQRKSISAHTGFHCFDRNGLGNIKDGRDKPSFLISAKRQPKWDHNLILTKERYQRGLSEEEIRMNRIMKQLSWYSPRDCHVPTLDRPDIKDYKTADWLQVTQHSKDETTNLH